MLGERGQDLQESQLKNMLGERPLTFLLPNTSSQGCPGGSTMPMHISYHQYKESDGAPERRSILSVDIELLQEALSWPYPVR